MKVLASKSKSLKVVKVYGPTVRHAYFTSSHLGAPEPIGVHRDTHELASGRKWCQEWGAKKWLLASISLEIKVG